MSRHHPRRRAPHAQEKATSAPPLIEALALQKLLHMDNLSAEYDDATNNAVRTFQRLHHLPTTGTADAATLAAIRSAQPELEAMQRARHCVVTQAASWLNAQCLCKTVMKPLIVLDPGHGNYLDDDGKKVHDTGTLVGGVPEATIALAVAKKLATKLEAEGFEVLLTRTSTNDVVSSRFAARWNAGATQKVFHISLHGDSAAPATQGMVVYYSAFAPKDSPSQRLARALGGGYAAPHRTDLVDPFVLGDTPSVVVEMGNLANDHDRKKLTSDAGQEAMAHLLSKRITDYYQVVQASLPMQLPKLGQSPLVMASSEMAISPTTPTAPAHQPPASAQR